MAKQSIVKTYTGLRNEQLLNNGGKYRLYAKNLDTPIGLAYDVYGNEKKRPENEKNGGLLSYTYNLDGEYGKKLNTSYGRDVERLGYYVVTNVKPSFMVNNYDGYGDYLSYLSETYGKRETYAGHLAGLLGVRDLAEDVAYDIFPNLEGKTFADTINEILQYSDIKYAMEHDKVGIVRDINVANASKGIITTNINNYSGKDTRMGMLTNQLYARTLLYAAQFNSLRRTKYITPELERLYGNNHANVYNLSTLFRINEDTGRIAEPVTDDFIKEIESGNMFDYLTTINPEYALPDSGYDWSKHPNYGPKNMYYGFHKALDSTQYEIDASRTTAVIDSDIKKISTVYKFHAEGDSNDGNAFNVAINNRRVNFTPQTMEISGKNILSTTNELLKNRSIDTLIGRFHTSKDKEQNLSQSAVHSTFGLSRGRNLLTKTAWETGNGTNVNGYDNPYCRVWTYHHQYSKMADLIRPFTDEGKFLGVDELQKNWNVFRNFKGEERLAKYSTLNKNGFVNITPTGDLDVDIKQCMFSIENLAWKDVNISGKGGYKFEKGSNENVGDFVKDYQHTLSEEQRGPNGGRIMWFPPYDLEFQETSSAEWNEANFIGRGEPVYTYNNTKRTGSLSFTLLIDHPAVLDYWMIDKKKGEKNVDDEQTLLRYFAGCETINPSEDVIKKILSGSYLGGTVDTTPIPPNTDIVFYTFFPNNYSGIDEMDNPEQVLERLFGGQNNNKLGVKFDDSDTEYFLGYEMGNNPISVEFTKTEFVNPNPWVLLSIKGREDAEVDGLDMYMEGGVNISLDDFKNSGSTYASYDVLVSDKETKEGIISANTETIVRYDEEINGLDEKIILAEEELENLYTEHISYESGTTQYILIGSKIDEKKEQIKGLSEEKDRKISAKEKLKELNETLRNDINSTATTQTIKDIEDKFVPGTNPYFKTNPLYLYRENKDSEFISGEYDEIYAKYILATLKTYDNETDFKDDENILTIKVPEYQVFKSKSDDGVKYWVVEVEITGDVPYPLFKTKKDFKKSSSYTGRLETKKGEKVDTTYMIKDSSGNVIEFSDTAAAKDKLDKISKTYSSKEEFKESGELFGLVGDDLISYYSVQESDTVAAQEKIMESFPEIDNEEFISAYYQNHVYMSPNEFSTQGPDYCMVQYYYEFCQASESSKQFAYKDEQDFIVRSVASEMNKTHMQESEEVKGSIANGTYEMSVFLDYDNDKNKKAYEYPYDSNKSNEQLTWAANYADLRSFGLNSTYEVVKREVGDGSVTCSFGEFFAGVKDGISGGTYTDFVLACERAILERYLNLKGEELEEKINEVSERIKYIGLVLNQQSKDIKTKVKSANIVGDASSDGQRSKNDALSKQRGEILKKYLKSLPVFGADENGYAPDVVNSTSGTTNVETPQDESKDISDIISKKDRNAKVVIVVGEDYINSDVSDNAVVSEGVDERFQSFSTGQTRYRRYDDERLFFQMLKENDDIAYSNLIDKVKFFSPAYHSITPEGFNARLTFLQQCTRQGPTVTASDLGTKTTAANLAFGRAPFCILRLGDFLNTKIVVKSVNITYPDSMWDLNPDGIGVQFMMAKVQMNIDIIGGSDISAPIKRLQNAVSFNYYANTSIYDNRSDISVYDDNGGVRAARTWNPELKKQ